RLVRSAQARYFLWLFAALNLLMAFGYLMFSGVLGLGDWAAVIKGWPGQIGWRIAEGGVGLALYFLVTPRLLWSGLEPFLGSGPEDRSRRARTLTLLPYLVGGATFLLAGLLNPHGLEVILISAVAASFGGTSLLAWYFTVSAGEHPPSGAAAMGIARSKGWMV